MLRKKLENGIIFIDHNEDTNLVMVNMSWKGVSGTQAGCVGFCAHKETLKELAQGLNEFFCEDV